MAKKYYLKSEAIAEKTIESSKLNSVVTDITYLDLVDLRNSGQMVPGMKYRIIDYVTTTAQAYTSAAGHVFDVIVTALNKNTIAEEAEAIYSDRDTDGYFSNSNLSAWKLWYCLDNDHSRFKWADDEYGTGVIYRMIDEYENDCPYDFKNIMFVRFKLNPPFNSGMESWCLPMLDNITSHFNNDLFPIMWSGVADGDHYWDIEKSIVSEISDINGAFYTFSYIPDFSNTGIVYDATIEHNTCYKNKINSHGNNGQELNNIVFFLNGGVCHSNSFGYNCHSNSLGDECYSNSFRDNCHSNSFGNNCYSNSFRDNCTNNSFGNYCYLNEVMNNCTNNSFGNYCCLNSFDYACISNIFGSDCSHNTLGFSCGSNILGHVCQYNIFGKECYSNEFGQNCSYNNLKTDCYRNTFEEYCIYNSLGLESNCIYFLENCRYNSFGNKCHDISLGSDCSSNQFGDGCMYESLGSNCSSNQFGNNCEDVTIGNSCYSIKMGDYCKHIKFGDSNQSKDFYRYITIESGNQYIYLLCNTSTSNGYFQYVYIGSGVNNTTTYKIIESDEVNQTHETKYVSVDTIDQFVTQLTPSQLNELTNLFE